MIIKLEVDPVEGHEIIRLCQLGIRLLKTSTREDKKIANMLEKELLPKIIKQYHCQIVLSSSKNINKGGLSD